ncbi:MAG: DUF4825 domain-containing protein [Oscillospiraceae bacterium]|nr:DUF4825 domain-containing protein [Oscillospiraceae bacterium]
MKTILPCEIVRDLLPSYVDGLTSETSNEAVLDHLDTCEGCREIYRQMRLPAPVPAVGGEAVPDHLRKMRRVHRRWLAAAISIVLVVLGVLAVRLFVVGSVDYAADPRVTVQTEESGQIVQISAHNPYGRFRKLRIKFERKEIRDVGSVLFCTPYSSVSLFSSDSDVFAQYVLDPGEELQAVVMIRPTGKGTEWYDRGDVAWYRGESIDMLASFLWKWYNPYVGDASADDNLVGLTLEYTAYDEKAFHLRLQTAEEPYGMTVVFDEPLYPREEKLQAIGCILLAQIGNLDHVTIEYSDTQGQTQLYTLTAGEASKLLGVDVKTVGTDLLAVQAMLDQLDK